MARKAAAIVPHIESALEEKRKHVIYIGEEDESDGKPVVRFKKSVKYMTQAEWMGHVLVAEAAGGHVQVKAADGTVQVIYNKPNVDLIKDLVDRLHGKPKNSIETSEAEKPNLTQDVLNMARELHEQIEKPA